MRCRAFRRNNQVRREVSDGSPSRHVALAFDPDRERLERQLAVEVDARARRTVLKLVDATRISCGEIGTTLVEPETAVHHIADAICRATSEVESWMGRASADRWLWALRRVPNHYFAGTYRSTGSYDRALAETLTSASTQEDEPSFHASGNIRYALDGTMPRRIAELITAARFISSLHVHYRRAAKGARVRVTDEGLITTVVEAQVERAIDRFDRRMDVNRSAPTGSVAYGPSQGVENGWLFLLRRCDAFQLPVEVAIPGRPPRLDIVAEHFPLQESSTPFIELLDELGSDCSNVYGPELGSLILFSRAVFPLLVIQPAGLFVALQRGYIFENRHRLEATLRSALKHDPVGQRVASTWPELCVEQILAHLSTPGSCWPLNRGPVVRGSTDVVILDLLAASERLDRAREYPRVDGPVANIRAQHFERQVQAAIDRTQWKPDDVVRSLVGRQIATSDGIITDLDAIAQRGPAVILVSCKSLIYGEDYDIGDHRAVRNAASTLDDAVSAWQSTVARVRANPCGRNYDLSGFQNIVGLVCTPCPVYTASIHEPAALGLASDVAIDELEAWLRNYD